MKTFLASSQKDVNTLAALLETAPPPYRPDIAARIIHGDLMRGPWWFQGLLWIIRRRRAPLQRLRVLYARSPNLADDLIKDTAKHMRHGHDREDATSVGGFSQREMNLMDYIIYHER